MRFSCSLVLASTLLACGGSGSLPQPISNKQADDPCDPGTGSTSSGAAPPVDAGSKPVALAGASGGIVFDELRFSANLAAILVPAGATGNVDLVDPSSEIVTTIGGFASEGGMPDFGSADEANGVIYAVDRAGATLRVISGTTHALLATAALGSTPEYVRYVSPTSELWVTEPADNRIEVLTVPASSSMPPVHAAFISVAGAESLEIDAAAARAFTNSATETLAIDVKGRTVTSTWKNGCMNAKGLALDPSHGWVMVGCAEGMAVNLDEHTGMMRGRVTLGGGVDRIAYDAVRLRLYVPTPAMSSMVVVALGPVTGAASVKGSVEVASDAHCVVTPGGGQLYVCVPSKGQLTYVSDPF